MPSPFPGMNPFLEQADAWEDFHQDFLVRAREALMAEVGENYLVKLAGQTNLVEIDLRRGGKRPHPPDLPPCDYYTLVSRYEDRPNVGFWPIALRERLPIVQVPLAAPDPDAHLDLQSVLDRTYDAAGFGSYIYSETPEPALTPDDAAWAATFLPKRD